MVEAAAATKTTSNGYVEDAESILALDDIQFEDVVVPEWNDAKFLVKSLTGEERDKLELSMLSVKRDGKGKVVSRTMNYVNMRAKLVAKSVVKSDRVTLVFTEDQAKRLGEKNAAALQRLFVVAQRLSGLSDDDVAELTEELGNDQSAASGSV